VKLPVVNADGKEVRKLDVDDSVFGIEPNASVLHQAYVIQRNNQRWGTAQTKTRGEVVGSTRKIRRQKYTGRARAGAESSPTRVGGGTIFGPRQRDYSQDLPKKMRRLAIRSALSGKAADGQLVVIDELAFEGPKTKEMTRILGNVGINRSALIVTGEADRAVHASARNLMKTKVLPARYLNVGDMLNHQGLLMTEEAVKVAETLWKTEIKTKAKKEEPKKAEPRRSRGAKAAEAAPQAEEETKPGRRTRFVKKDTKAETEAETAAKTEVTTEATEATAEEKKPARRTRRTTKKADEGEGTAKAEASAEEKPKRATRSRAKKADDSGDDKPKATRRRTTRKKTEEGQG
jgi:large subunit ribosomal protein L4